MATTTPNFGWTVPTSTDLVKNGATAIETLGDSIDASFVGLKGGTTGQVLSKTSGTDLAFTWVAQDDSNAIQNAIVDAKGDLIGATAADTPARLAVGTNGQFLTADSTASTGLAWTTVSTGAYTTIASGTLSSAALSITSIPSTYKELLLVLTNMTHTSNFDIGLRFNSDSTSGNYIFLWNRLLNGTASSYGATDTLLPINGEGFKASTQYNQGTVRFSNYTESTWKVVHSVNSGIDRISSAFEVTNMVGSWKSTSAISTIATTGSMSGNYILYGIK